MKHSNRTGIWIPREIECLNNLTLTEKYLLSEIRSLTLAKGCFATNAYFAKLLGKKPDTISRLITKLKKFKLIEQISFDGRRRELQYSLGSKSNAETTNQTLCIRPESNAESDSAYTSNISLKSNIQKIYNDESNWKEFVKWASRLAPSTQERIRKVNSPDSLEIRDQIFWRNFQLRYG